MIFINILTYKQLFFGEMTKCSIVLFSDRVAIGRALDLPVYFGDAGSREVVKHKSENYVIHM